MQLGSANDLRMLFFGRANRISGFWGRILVSSAIANDWAMLDTAVEAVPFQQSMIWPMPCSSRLTQKKSIPGASGSEIQFKLFASIVHVHKMRRASTSMPWETVPTCGRKCWFMRNKLQETDWFLLYGFAMLWPAKKLLGSIPATKIPSTQSNNYHLEGQICFVNFSW